MNDKEIFGKNFKRLIKKNQTTRKQVCEELGLKYSTTSEWIGGKRYPRIENIRKISEYFKVPLGELVGNNQESKEKYFEFVEELQKEIRKNNNKMKINDDEYIKLEIIERILKI